jgi:hypothetical protein
MGDVSMLRRMLASGADISRWAHEAAESAARFAVISNASFEVLEALREAGLDMAARAP